MAPMEQSTLKFSGAKIRQTRHEKGWTQAELAFRAGVRERQVIRWENDQNEPRLDGITKIAAATGREVSDFMADPAASSEDDEEAALDFGSAINALIERAVEAKLSAALRELTA